MGFESMLFGTMRLWEWCVSLLGSCSVGLDAQISSDICRRGVLWFVFDGHTRSHPPLPTPHPWLPMDPRDLVCSHKLILVGLCWIWAFVGFQMLLVGNGGAFPVWDRARVGLRLDLRAFVGLRMPTFWSPSVWGLLF